MTEDIYVRGAARAFGVPESDVTKIQRQCFKERFFTTMYSVSTTRENVLALVDALADLMKADGSR